MGITAKELARKLNLSAAAVSMALNHKPGVSTATRQLVLDAAEKYGYDFSRIAEKHTTSGAIYFVYSDCAGIILLGTEMEGGDLKPFLNLPIPVVLLDAYFETVPCNCVLINNVQGAYLAARHLIRTCKTQPGYLRSAYQISNFAERSSGFYKAVRAAGMSSSRSIVHSLTPSMEGAYTDMLELIKNGEELASCYFADNDLIAVGAMKALKESGYRIPQDIGIVGFDNLPLGSVVEPALTTIHVPKQYMGEAAAQKLIDLLNTPGQPPTKTEVSTMLVKRGTV